MRRASAPAGKMDAGTEFLVSVARRSGFFSHFFHVLSSVIEAEGRNVKHYVYFNSLFRYWSPGGWRGRRNAWEYYFGQIDDVPLSRLFDSDEESLEGMGRKELAARTLPGVRISRGWWEVVGMYGLMSPEQRSRVSAAVQGRIRLQDDVRLRFDALRGELLGGDRAVGVHYRGDDKAPEVGHATGRRAAGFGVYKAVVDAYLDRTPGRRIFLATDDELAWSDAKRRYGERLLSTDARRSPKGRVHRDADPKMGEEVLMDALLLSSCEHLIHGLSSVSSAALCWNGSLGHTDVYGSLPPWAKEAVEKHEAGA